MAKPNEPWTTTYPDAQDTPGVQQPNLSNDSYPGAEDGHRFIVEHVHALRDKLQAVCLKVGDVDGNPTLTSLEYRVQELEAGGGGGGAPTGPAGPDYLGGTYPNPEVIAVKESGGEKLAMGSITDTEYLIRSGSTVTSTVPSHFSDTGNPHAVTKTQVNLSNVENLKVNLTATTEPIDAHSGTGYTVGSRWIDTVADKEYVCLNAEPGGPVWIETTQSGGASDTLFNEDSAITIGNETPDTQLNTVLDNSPLTSTNTLSGYALEAYRNGRKMLYVSSLTAGKYDEYKYVHGATTVSYLAAGEEDQYEFTYFSSLSGAGSGVNDPNAIHSNEPSEIYNITLKATPAAEDVFLCESETHSWAKRKVPFSALGSGGGTDTSAVHVDQEDEIHQIATEETIDSSSEIIYESATATPTWAKKRAAFSALPIRDTDALHKDTLGAGEINALTNEASPTGSDILLIEKAGDSFNKYKLAIGNLPTGADPNAIHDNAENEIAAIANEETTPNGADFLLIESYNNSWAKRKLALSNLPSGSGTDADAIHKSTSGEINSITEATSTNVGDVLVLESSGSFAKRKVTVNTLVPVESRFETVDQPSSSVEGKYSSISAAITALNGGSGGTILLMPGTYYISGNITVTKPISIIGLGSVTIVDSCASGVMVTYSTGSDGSSLENVNMQNATTSDLIELSSIEGFTATRCRFQGQIAIDASKRIRFSRCTLTYTSSGQSGDLVAIGGLACDTVFDTCHVSGVNNSFCFHVNSGISGSAYSRVALLNCIIDHDGAGGVWVELLGKLDLIGTKFICRKNPSGTYPSAIKIYDSSANSSNYNIKECEVRMVDSGTDFTDILVEVYCASALAAVNIDSLYIDLAYVQIIPSSARYTPVFLSGAQINVNRMIVERIKLPDIVVNSTNFCAVTLDPLQPTSPANMQGYIDLTNCVFRRITYNPSLPTFGQFAADVAGTPPTLSGKGNLRFINCYFDAVEHTEDYDAVNTCNMISVDKSDASAESTVEIKGCYFTGGAWKSIIYVNNKAVIIQSNQFMFADSADDDVEHFIWVNGYWDYLARRSSFCNVSHNTIQRNMLYSAGSNHTIRLYQYHTIICTNNCVTRKDGSGGAESDIHISECNHAVVQGNFTYNGISATAEFMTFLGNSAYSFSVTGTEKLRPVSGSIEDFNVINWSLS